MKFTYHRISWMIFPLRCGGYWVMSTSALILYLHGLISPWVGIYAIFTALVWAPAILYLSAQMPAANAKHFELKTLEYFDPLLTGIWLVLAHCSLWYGLFALLGLGAGICSVMGFFAWLRGLFIIVILGVIAFWMNGFSILIYTPIELKIFAFLACTVFMTLIGIAQFKVRTRIESTKKELELAAQELKQINLFMQTTIASKTIRELTQHIDQLMHDFFAFKATSLCLLEQNEQELEFYDVEHHRILKIYRSKFESLSQEDLLLKNVIDQSMGKIIDDRCEDVMDFTITQAYLNTHKAKSAFILPLIHGNKKLGCLCLFSDNYIDSTLMEKLTGYLNNIAIIVNNRQTFNEFNKSQHELREKNMRLKDESKKLSRYLSPQIYQWIFSEKEVDLSSTRKRITFLVVSMQNFYKVLDQLDSDEITDFVNSYLTCMAELIEQHGGTIDQYLGVQIRVFFGDPTTLGVKKDALQSLALALSMQAGFQQFKQRWPSDLVEDLGLRIAISSGYTDVGNFGSAQRMNYTIIGSMVNLAFRLLLNAKAEQILMTEDTYLLTKDYIKVIQEEDIHILHEPNTTHVYRLCTLTNLSMVVIE